MGGDGLSSLRVPVWGLFILAVGAVLYIADVIFVPVFLALIVSFLLTPMVRWLRRHHIPRTIGSALVIMLFTGVFATITNYLAEPVSVWMERLPSEFSQIERKLVFFKSSIESVQDATQRIEDMASVDHARKQEVVVKGPSMIYMLIDNTQALLVRLVSFYVLLYFMLAFGDSLGRDLARLFAPNGNRMVFARIAREAQQQVSHYLLLVTAINIGLGLLVTLGLWAVDVPNPAVWGASAAILNYIPYVGPAVNIVVVSMVSLISFDSLAQSAVPPLILLSLNLLEGQIIQPMFVGKLFTINPVIIFLSILFWGWIWGVPGILMAVPLQMVLSIVLDQLRQSKSKPPVLASTSD